MKRIILTILLVFVAFSGLIAQDYLFGNNDLCQTESISQTKAPKGYEAFYMSHYGRHGARYAWQSDIYDRIKEVFGKAEAEGNLTETGKDFKTRFDRLYPVLYQHPGELSAKGWNQQVALGALACSSYPTVFCDGAVVRACTSTSTRCIMSMSAFCIGLAKRNPALDIKENYGNSFLKGVLPLSHRNPYRNEDYEKTPLPFDEAPEAFIGRKINYVAVLERLFNNVSQALPEDGWWQFAEYLSVFADGMKSIDTDEDFTDIFTEQERRAFWEINNFNFYTGALPDHKAYQAVVDDIVEKADARIADGVKGADLRFSHDDSMLSLMIFLGVAGYDHEIKTADDISLYCPMHNIPMGANLHFVFYRSRKSDRILFKVLLNGEETQISMPTDQSPYYDWETFKSIYCK